MKPHSLKPYLLTGALFLLFLLVFLRSTLPAMQEYQRQEETRQQWSALVRKQEALLKHSLRERKALLEDPFYNERILRLQYGH